jgi:hypothetical protein
MCCSAQGLYDVIGDVLSKLFHIVKTFQKIVFSNMKHSQAWKHQVINWIQLILEPKQHENVIHHLMHIKHFGLLPSYLLFQN